MAISRQVRRANERRALKVIKASYPRGLTSDGLQVQRDEPFQPSGKTWVVTGQQEAARRLRRMEG